ncbi:MAG: hypothetical protein ACP5OV_03670 [Acidimicrobiales bacterium]
MSRSQRPWSARGASAALVLALVITAAPGASGAEPSATTQWPTALCGPASPQSTSVLTQSLTGALHGCLRLGPTSSRSVSVAVQGFVTQHAELWSVPLTGQSTGLTGDGTFHLSATPSVVRPGQPVTLTMTYPHRHPADLSGYVDLCWDGCQSGLGEQGVPTHVVSARVVQARLVVPAAPWFQWTHGRVVVHPLASGTYPVGLECAVVGSGCALLPADAQVPVRLVAPASAPCDAAHACAALSVSATHAQVGDVLAVHGRAPLEAIIGQAFGFSLTTEPSRPHEPWLRLAATASATEQTAVLAPRAVALTPLPPWRTEPAWHVVAASWSGLSSASPGPVAGDVTWCDPGVIVASGPAHPTVRIGTRGIVHALVGTGESLVGLLGPPTCASALVDPSQPLVAYAVVDVGAHGMIPPTLLAGLETTDGGRQWHLIPHPPRTTTGGFGGFVSLGSTVEAVFARSSATTAAAETTAFGSTRWVSATLGCPLRGPCATWGPYQPGNCAMNGTWQSLLIGQTSPTGTRWGTSTWVTAVDACASVELAATGPRDLVLLDPTSTSSLLVSADGGRSWHAVALPHLAGLATGGGVGQGLALAPDGSLLAQVTDGAGASVLDRLGVGASSWCHAATLATRLVSASPIRIAGDDVVWTTQSQTRPAPVINHRLVAARLTCRPASA